MAADVSRRINAERIALIGWLRALLLHLSHPLIAAGVARHSTFGGGAAAAFGRLHHTIGAMLDITFGAPPARERALEGIRTIHRRVNGTLDAGCGVFPAGTRYSAEDSTLLIWVHATLAESIVMTYERLVAPLTPAERDAYCADSAEVAVELGARSAEVPRSWATVQAHVAARLASGEIVVCDTARTLAAMIVSPLPGWSGGALVRPVATLLVAGLLPPMVRQQYGFAWSDGRAARFDRAMRLLRAMRRVTPDAIGCWRIARRARR